MLFNLATLVFKSGLLLLKRFGIWLLSKLKNSNSKTKQEELFSSLGILFREFFAAQAGFYIKFGQLISHRYDIFPKPFCDEMLSLTDQVSPLNWEDLAKVVDLEIGLDKFSYIDTKPLASASIAQVHFAELENKEKVVIKIQRPGIEQKMKKDLKDIKLLVWIFDKSRIFPKMRDIYEEFKIWLDQEIDFIHESQNLVKMAEADYALVPLNSKLPKRYNVPKIYPDLTTKKILVMEFIQGQTLLNLSKDVVLTVEQRKEISLQVLRSFLKQFLLDGFFQADPHLSNLIYSTDKKLYYIDLGLCGSFSNYQALSLLRMYRGFVFRDLSVCWNGLTQLLELNENDQKLIRKDFKRLFEELSQLPEFDLTSPYRKSGTKFLSTLLGLLVKYKINIPETASLAFKTMATTDTVLTSIYEELTVDDMFDAVMDASLQFVYKLFFDHPLLELTLQTGFKAQPKDLKRLMISLKTKKLFNQFDLSGLLDYFNLLTVNSADMDKIAEKLKVVSSLEEMWLNTNVKPF